MIIRKMKITFFLFCVLLSLCLRDTLCLSCSDSPGISYIPCQEIRRSGGSGGGNATHHVDEGLPIESCIDVEFEGAGHQTYQVADDDVPIEYEIRITELDLIDDEEIIIKSFQCDSPDECQIAVIDSSATTPLTITMNKRRFTFVSHASFAYAKFYITQNCICKNAGFDRNGEKSLRFIGADYQFEECLEICEKNISSMIKITTQEELDSIYTLVWIGLRQISPTSYQWTDGETITVDLGTGDVIDYSLAPWYRSNTRMHYWDMDGVQDSENCFIADAEGWGEVNCYESRACMCECTV